MNSSGEAKASIAIVKLSSLGDLLHALPAVHCLKSGLNASITWIVQEEYGELVSCFSDVDEMLTIERSRYLSSVAAIHRTLSGRFFDLVIDLQGLMKSAIVARAMRGRKRIGPSFCREGSRLLYSEVAGSRNRSRHAVEENLDVVRHLGLPCEERVFNLEFPEARLEAAHPLVAMIPGSRWPSKRWPAERYAEVGRMLMAKTGGSIVLLGGKDEMELGEQIAAGVGDGVIDRVGNTSIVEMGSILAGADLVVSNDSGPMHMAAALGIHVLALFGPTDPVRTGPFGAGHRVLVSDVDCRPCFGRSCRLTGPECMTGITAKQVVSAALEMLRTTDQPRDKPGADTDEHR